jgi:gliding motility-associated-like protein
VLEFFIQGDDNIVSFRINGTLITSTPFGWSNTSSVKINNSLLNSGSNIFTIEGTNNGSCGWVAARIVIYTDSCKNSENQTCDTSGLILCMAMDGNANDSTKYNNHGIIRGATPTIGRDGKTNSAYYFNGTTNHINLGVKNILKPSAASISVWVKPHTFNSYIGTNSNTIIITKNPNNPSSYMEGYSLSLTNRTGPTKYMAINTHQPTNNEKWFMSNQNTNINQWTHLVLTFDFDSIKLYVNGQLDNKIYKGFNNVYDAFDSVVIGYSANIMNKNYFKGDIDELKMYNRVLSSSEILNLYTKPFTCSCSSSNSSNQTDCDTTNLNVGKVLHLDFNGNTQDKSGNNNHATNFGAMPVAGKDGVANTAYRFDGINDYMKVNHHSSLNNSNITLTILIKPNGFYNGTCYGNQIMKKGQTDFVNGEYGMIYSPGAFTNSCYQFDTFHQNYAGFTYNNRPSANLNNIAPYVKSGQWDCLVYTKDSDSSKFYINGILKYATSSVNHGTNFDDVFIGKMDNSQYPYWLNGDIDDIRIYNRALSASEVKGYCGTCNISPPANSDCDTTNINIGLLAHYKLDGNANDASGNNKNGTTIGGLQYGNLKKSNGAFFDGIDDKININSPILNNISNFTVSVFFKLQEKLTYLSNGGKIGIIYSESINGWNGTGFSVFLVNLDNVNTALYAQWSNGSGVQMQNFIIKSGYIDTGVVYCFNIVRKSDTMYLYIDGNMIEKVYNPYTNAANSNGQIGGNSISSNPSHNGYVKLGIDDIRIYNRALSASEVKGYCGTCNISPPISVKCDTGKKYVYTKCFNDTIQLNVGKGKNHLWSPTTDLSNGTIQNPKCFAKSSIQYFVLYNDTHNCQIIDTFQINVFPSNHIPLFDSTVCIGDSIFYSLDNNGTNYNWNPNQYLSSNNQSSVWIKPLTNTSYNISYKDLNGCKILDTFNLKTKVCCDLKALFEISDSIICKSGLVSIFNKSKNITNGIYSWEFKNLTPSQFTGYSPASISLNSPGSYSIKLKTSNGICEDSMIRNIYVIDIKANAGKDSTFCTGRISNFKIGNTNTISDYKYSWNPTLGLDNADISSPTVNISQNQQYELSVYDPFTGCIDLDTIILTINSNLDTFNYVDTLCEGDTKVFFGQNIMIDGTYQHYVKDNQNCDIEVHILKVFFRKISYTNSIQKACNFYIDKMGIKHTDSFEYNDTTYTKGCITNIHTTKIKILKTRYEETDMTACYKINWKGNTYYDTIKKIDSFVFKDNGCDTLVKYVNLNIVKKAKIKIISTHANPLNYGEEIILQAFGSNNYKWNTGERGFQIIHKAKENNVFYVIGYNNVLCPDTAYYNIYIDNNSGIELPDIFSPNDDGKNDIFRPSYKGNVQILDFIVYNRWGEKIYEGHGNEVFWDGKFKGEYQSSGVYIYLFKYIFNGKEVSKKGSFVLVR